MTKILTIVKQMFKLKVRNEESMMVAGEAGWQCQGDNC